MPLSLVETDSKHFQESLQFTNRRNKNQKNTIVQQIIIKSTFSSKKIENDGKAEQKRKNRSNSGADPGFRGAQISPG